MSMKALANLVCEASVRSSPNVLTRELDRNLPELKKGVQAFGAPPPPPTATASTSADSHKKLGTFIRELSQFLQVGEDQSKKILATYLAGKFSSIYSCSFCQKVDVLTLGGDFSSVLGNLCPFVKASKYPVVA